MVYVSVCVQVFRIVCGMFRGPMGATVTSSGASPALESDRMWGFSKCVSSMCDCVGHICNCVELKSILNPGVRKVDEGADRMPPILRSQIRLRTIKRSLARITTAIKWPLPTVTVPTFSKFPPSRKCLTTVLQHNFKCNHIEGLLKNIKTTESGEIRSKMTKKGGKMNEIVCNKVLS